MNEKLTRYNGHNPLTAADMNRIIDNLEALANLRATPPLSVVRTDSGFLISLDTRPEGLVLVTNVTNSTLGRFSILGIDNVKWTPTSDLYRFQNQLVYIGVTPNICSHLGRFIILDDELKYNETGWGIISGECAVKINVLDEDHRFADIKDGDTTQLESSYKGAATILYKDSGLGLKWARVRIASGYNLELEGGDLVYKRPEVGGDDGWLLIDEDPESNFYGKLVHGDPQSWKLDTSLLPDS